MVRDGPRQRVTKCRSPASKKHLDRLKKHTGIASASNSKEFIGQTDLMRRALLGLFNSATKLNHWKTLNERTKFIIKILEIILIGVFIYYLIQNPQLAEELVKEIVRNLIIN
jgi:hypothetical protein